ncbi:MAG: DUF4917 family protein [Acidobacteria bacterium]|nr:DUF4917 family protein [Acidobacteriota bacterium]
MQPGGKPLTAKLEDWGNLREECEFTGLLLGNGASRNVWEGFGYDSLYQIACAENATHRLDTTDQRLFDELGTRSFERVLGGLAVAQLVNRSCSVECGELEERYASIQEALVEAVRNHHIAWSVVEGGIRHSMRDALLDYSFVYSTNYDLLVYWAVMADNGSGFKDYFWSDEFDLGNVEVWGKTTRVLYLHGGLHLCRTARGLSVKRRASSNSNLLEDFGSLYNGERVTPLFVAEGTAADKLRSLYRSDYLSFAYSRLANHMGDLCVFGQALGEEDSHIVRAIRSSMAKKVAVSIRPSSDEEIIKRKAAYIGNFPTLGIRFYNSTTHPLGSPLLRACEEVT